MIIAIDGHSSCGKSSFAKRIASELSFLYIDSGAMYRAVTLFCIENDLKKMNSVNIPGLISKLDQINIEFRSRETEANQEVYLNGINIEKEIRSMLVSSMVSEVSKIPEVREQMVFLQRKLTESKSVVMDGRDIGTVVFPNAEIKIFMTASLKVRAQRRYLELKEKGIKADMKSVKANLAERDEIDQGREISPLKMAEDAILLDNSEMTMEDQMQWFRKLMEEKSK